MALLFACFCLGSWLGMRFKVAIVVPATFAAIVIIWCIGWLGDQPHSVVIVAQVAAAVVIQAGYLTAALIGARGARSEAEPNVVAGDAG